MQLVAAGAGLVLLGLVAFVLADPLIGCVRCRAAPPARAVGPWLGALACGLLVVASSPPAGVTWAANVLAGWPVVLVALVLGVAARNAFDARGGDVDTSGGVVDARDAAVDACGAVVHLPGAHVARGAGAELPEIDAAGRRAR